MLASQRHPRHAVDAEILLIKSPKAEKFVYDRSLLTSTCGFGYVAWILNHTANVEICAEAVS